MNGLHGRFLDVDLSSERIRVVEIPRAIYRRFIGGRGLATYILWRELGNKWRSIDPLGPENLLVIATGPLTGYYPGIKLVVSGKSPQSGGVVGSTVSSELAVELKAAGYDGIIVRGSADDPVYLYVDDDNVEIRSATRLWGKTGLELLRTLVQEFEWPSRLGMTSPPASIYIGPAGENKVRTAAVMSKLAHAAGYGGYGAVMGSKNLKAVVAKGTGPLPRVADPTRVSELRKYVTSKLLEQKSFRHWGTTRGIWSVGYVTSSEPVKNWLEEWHDNPSVNHVVFEEGYWVKNPWADWGCPLGCMKISRARLRDKTYLTDGPDYEMGAYLGPNLGIFDPAEIVALSSLADELGLCGIQTGNVMAFAVELFNRGVIDESDVGYKLEWGCFECAKRLMEDVAYRRGIGKILAEGVYRAAVEISRRKNVDVLKYAVQVKGIAVGAHGIRSRRDYPQLIAYAGSVQGGDHTSTAGLPHNSRESESYAAFIDSGVICMFTTFPVGEETIVEYLNAVTGWRVSLEEVYEDIGPRILSLQRLLLLLGGPDVQWDPRVHDDNPPRFYEPLPSGPYKGQSIDREETRRQLEEYYSRLGWDKYGIPLADTLRRLGLGELIPLADTLRKSIMDGDQ